MAKINIVYYVGLYILLVEGINGVRIQFFKSSDISTPVFESSSTEKCINKNLDSWTIKTDTCVVTYMHPNCQSYWSKKFLPNQNASSHGTLGSFHVCNEDAGGPQLNLDITTYYSDESTIPTILQSYKNLCTCVNVSPEVQNLSQWSIDTHGNELWGYFEPDCSETKWEPLYISTGSWGYTKDITRDHKRIDTAIDRSIDQHLYIPSKIIQLEQNCKDSKQEAERYHRKIETRLDIHIKEFENTTANVNGLQREVGQLKQNFEECRKSIDDSQREYLKDFQSLTVTIKELQAQILQLTQKIQELEANAQRTESHFDNGLKYMDDKLEKQMVEFDELHGQFNNHVHM